MRYAVSNKQKDNQNIDLKASKITSRDVSGSFFSGLLSLEVFGRATWSDSSDYLGDIEDLEDLGDLGDPVPKSRSPPRRVFVGFGGYGGGRRGKLSH